MNLFAKVLFLAVLGVGCLTLNTGAQPPAPAAPAKPATAPVAPVATPVPAPPPGAVLDVHFAPLPPPKAQSSTNIDFEFWLCGVVDLEDLRLTLQLAHAKTEADKEKIKGKMKELLVKEFDERQKRYEKELEALEAQVKKLKEMVNKRQDNKREIIDERMKQLQRDAQGLGW